MKQNIGIYPGSFDPIHKGHIAFALETARKCNLDSIIFLPEHSPRKKNNVTPLLERLPQIEKTLRDYNNLEVLVLNTHTFTHRTAMPEIRAALGKNTNLTLLIGSDVAKGLAGGWEDAEQLFGECSLAVGLRGDDTIELITDTIRQVSYISSKYSVVTTSFPLESSSGERYFNDAVQQSR